MFNMCFALLSYIAVGACLRVQTVQCHRGTYNLFAGLLFITYLIIFNAWFSEFGDSGETYSFILSASIAAQIFLVFLVGTIGNVTEQKNILVVVSHCMSVLNVAGLVIGTWVFLRSGISLLIVAGTYFIRMSVLPAALYFASRGFRFLPGFHCRGHCLVQPKPPNNRLSFLFIEGAFICDHLYDFFGDQHPRFFLGYQGGPAVPRKVQIAAARSIEHTK